MKVVVSAWGLYCSLTDAAAPSILSVELSETRRRKFSIVPGRI